MSILNLLVRKSKGKIDNIQLDATISENHDLVSTITKYPVESGAEITDHIVNDPVSLTMEGFITNTPVGFGLLQGRIGSIIRREPYDRRKTAFDELLRLWEAKQLFTVITGLKTYENMFFTSLSIPRDNNTGEALRFTATMTQIITVSAKTVKLKDIAPDYNDISQSQVSNGVQNKKSVVEGGRTQSVAFKGVRGIKNFFSGLFQ